MDWTVPIMLSESPFPREHEATSGTGCGPGPGIPGREKSPAPWRDVPGNDDTTLLSFFDNGSLVCDSMGIFPATSTCPCEGQAPTLDGGAALLGVRPEIFDQRDDHHLLAHAADQFVALPDLLDESASCGSEKASSMTAGENDDHMPPPLMAPSPPPLMEAEQRPSEAEIACAPAATSSHLGSSGIASRKKSMRERSTRSQEHDASLEPRVKRTMLTRALYGSTLAYARYKPTYTTIRKRKRLFKCSWCDYENVNFLSLMGHMCAFHTCECPVVCDACGFEACYIGELEKHVRTHHRGHNLAAMFPDVVVCALRERGCEVGVTPVITPVAPALEQDQLTPAAFSAIRTDVESYDTSTAYASSDTQQHSSPSLLEPGDPTVTPTAPTMPSDKLFRAPRVNFYAATRAFREYRNATSTDASGKLVHTCDYCTYASRAMNDVMAHICVKHTKEQPFKCPWCGMVSAYAINFARHLARRHKVYNSETVFLDKSTAATQRPAFRCKGYESTRAYREYRDTSVASDMGERFHACNRCDFATLAPVTLMAHVCRCHTHEKPFVCQRCSYRTFTHDVLRSHKKRCDHGEERGESAEAGGR